jgi:hypothetical protein
MSDKERNPAKAANAVIQRLLQMRQLWGDAAASYFDPSRFQLNVQNCITISRTVTFILQANKEHMNGFDAWYEGHRTRWNGDPVMRWARDARNSIEKRGDLDTYSQVRATIIVGYLGGPETQWLPQALFYSPLQVFQTVPKRFFIPHIIENGTLLIERRWVDNEFPDMEILEALAYVYGQLADTVVDYLKTNKLKIPPKLADTRPDAMGALAMDRALYLSMRDGTITGNRYFHKPMEQIGPKAEKRIKSRYGSGANWSALAEAKTFREVAQVYFDHARIVLLRDGYHRNFTFFLKDGIVFRMIPTDHPDRASRYVLVRDLAKLARIDGADGVMMIAEAWTAAADDIPPSGFAVEAKNRGESLTMHAASAKGESFSLNARFHRRRPGGKKVKAIDKTVCEDDGFLFIMCPFLHEWGILDMAEVMQAVQRVDDAGIITPEIEAE